jgi:hypothetical protein
MNVAYFHQQLSKFPYRQRLLINFVHSTLDGPIDILFLDVTCYCYYLGLLAQFDVLLGIESSNYFGRLVPIKERHVAIHKYELVAHGIVVV